MACKSKAAEIYHKLPLVISVMALSCWGGAAFAQFPQPRANCDISGGVNNGIQIQNCPTVIQAPTPSFHVIKEYPIATNADGSFTRSADIEIDAPYVPGNMLIWALGPTVTSILVTNKSMVVGGPSKDPNVHAFYVSEPWGRYTVSIITSDTLLKPTMQIAFNQDVNIQ